MLWHYVNNHNILFHTVVFSFNEKKAVVPNCSVVCMFCKAESLQRSRNHDETEDSWILCTPLRKLNANHFDTKNKTYAHTLSHHFSLGNYSLMISHIWNGSFIAAIVKRKRLDFFFASFWNCVMCVTYSS